MNSAIKSLEGATGLKSAQIFQYGLIAGVLLVMLGVGNVYITTLLGVAYPAFMSFVALETEDKEDDKQWLTYWVCFSMFSIIDQFAGIILSFIPFYFFIKLAFLVFLFHPKTLGATWVYNSYLSGYVKMYRTKVEQAQKDLVRQAARATGVQ